MDVLGISKQHIKKVLNHTETDVTESYIRHDAAKQKRLALDRWAARLADIIEGREVVEKVVPIGRSA